MVKGNDNWNLNWNELKLELVRRDSLFFFSNWVFYGELDVESIEHKTKPPFPDNLWNSMDVSPYFLN